MKLLQKTAVSALSFLLLLSGCASGQTATASVTASASVPAAAQTGLMSGRNGGSMSTDKSADTELQALISATASAFTQGSYTDAETGLTVPYDIYVPADYDASKTYPMVVFIGDATTVGTDMQYPLTQGWGGLIWASSEVQSSQECIVLVPVYPATVIDDNGTATISDYLYLTPRMNIEADGNILIGIGIIDRIIRCAQKPAAADEALYRVGDESVFAGQIVRRIRNDLLLRPGRMRPAAARRKKHSCRYGCDDCSFPEFSHAAVPLLQDSSPGNSYSRVRTGASQILYHTSALSIRPVCHCKATFFLQTAAIFCRIIFVKSVKIRTDRNISRAPVLGEA